MRHTTISTRQVFTYSKSDPGVFEYTSEFLVHELQRPCTLRVKGDHAVVAALEGPVGILDHKNQLVSLINVSDLLGWDGHLHPHDAILLPNGDLVVCTWNPGRISYWRRIKPRRECGEQ